MTRDNVYNCGFSLFAALLFAAAIFEQSMAQMPPGSGPVSRAEAQCIAENAEALLEDPEDPVTVYLDICVSKDKQKSIIAGEVRADLPNLREAPIKSDAPAIRSVTLSKKILQCLRSYIGDPSFPASDPVDLEQVCR